MDLEQLEQPALELHDAVEVPAELHLEAHFEGDHLEGGQRTGCTLRMVPAGQDSSVVGNQQAVVGSPVAGNLAEGSQDSQLEERHMHCTHKVLQVLHKGLPDWVGSQGNLQEQGSLEEDIPDNESPVGHAMQPEHRVLLVRQKGCLKMPMQVSGPARGPVPLQ